VTVPPAAKKVATTLADMVRGMGLRLRQEMSPEEQRIAVYLRGNEDLYEGFRCLIQSRFEGRAKLPLPSTPQECQISMARDKELQWLLGRLEYVYRSALKAAPEGEQPE